MPAAPVAALVAAVVLAVVHLEARRLQLLDAVPRRRWLSFGAGVSVAYVFLHLLPDVAAFELAAIEAGHPSPGWLVVLAGLVAFYGLERAARSARPGPRRASTTADAVGWLHVASYAAYNAVIGYVLVEQAELGADALALFAIAIGLHFVVNDHGLRAEHGRLYHVVGRWILAGAVVAGWGLAATTTVTEEVLGLLVAFLGGGVVLNVLKEELPEERESRFGAFVLGVVGYGALLLAL